MRRSGLLSIVFILVLSSFLWSRGAPEQEIAAPREFTAEVARAIRDNLIPFFEGDISALPSQDEMIFLKHYKGDSFPGTSRLGYFVSGERRLAAYLFLPDKDVIKGTVYLLHGYLDHTLSNKYMIKYLLENNYAVLGFDLPGHGLSEGEPAAIDDFREYAAALARFFNLSEPLRKGILSGPVTALAHSTGCSVLMETEALYGNIFDSIIMVSPLVHSVGWRFTSLGLGLAEPFTDSVFRRFGGSSSNKEHESFVQHQDPLQSRSVPFSWIYAQEDWFDRMESLPVNNELNLSIIQGEEDRVVDFDFNIPFLLEKYPNADLYLFPEGEHSLFNEIPEMRETVFQQILECLETAGTP